MGGLSKVLRDFGSHFSSGKLQGTASAGSQAQRFVQIRIHRYAYRGAIETVLQQKFGPRLREVNGIWERMWFISVGFKENFPVLSMDDWV